VPVNSVRKCRFPLSWSIGPGKRHHQLGAHRSRTAGPGRDAGVEGTAALVVAPQTVIENTEYLV